MVGLSKLSLSFFHRVTLTDGASHAVDSSDMAFRIAAASAVREAIRNAGPHILEPVMAVEVWWWWCTHYYVFVGLDLIVHCTQPLILGYGPCRISGGPCDKCQPSYGYGTGRSTALLHSTCVSSNHSPNLSMLLLLLSQICRMLV